MYSIINGLLLLLLQPAPIRCWDEITWPGREAQISKAGGEKRRDTLLLHPLCHSTHYSSCSHNDARGDEERMVEGGGRIDRQGGAAEWQREAGEDGSCSTEDQETEGGGGRRGCTSTGRECRQQRGGTGGRDGGVGEGGGGLPDRMGPAMPWWSMGQVLGFSHCRKSAFVLLFPFRVSLWEVWVVLSVYFTVASLHKYIFQGSIFSC